MLTFSSVYEFTEWATIIYKWIKIYDLRASISLYVIPTWQLRISLKADDQEFTL